MTTTKEKHITEAFEVDEECTLCGGTGEIEIMGDGPNFEWDVIRTERCECVDKIPF